MPAEPRISLAAVEELDDLARGFSRRLRDVAVEFSGGAGHSMPIGPEAILEAVPLVCGKLLLRSTPISGFDRALSVELPRLVPGAARAEAALSCPGRRGKCIVLEVVRLVPRTPKVGFHFLGQVAAKGGRRRSRTPSSGHRAGERPCRPERGIADLALASSGIRTCPPWKINSRIEQTLRISIFGRVVRGHNGRPSEGRPNQEQRRNDSHRRQVKLMSGNS